MLNFKPFMSENNYSAKVVDLFCGVGGLTHGLVKESFEVVAGYDIDTTCQFAYEENNKSTFIAKDIVSVIGDEILKHYENATVKILVGCSPCQPFSTYSYKHQDENKYSLLNQFARLIKEVQPDIVSMENVPRLAEFSKEPIFSSFLQTLEQNGYKYSWEIVNCPDYGIPQNRKRLVLLASKYGEIELIPKTHTPENYVTVEDTIKNLEPLESGQVSEKDFLHRASKLSPLNLERIKQS
ncbi:MAG: DNA (cytosine-5-)-methyltransferase, partial [Pyrinomonadaceae bacterium]|nr:DNA (cytosine-5-)-methyltransferase [Pyrinomonadaceae bacterium]